MNTFARRRSRGSGLQNAPRPGQALISRLFGLKAAIIAASAASHRVAPAALVTRPEGTPIAVFAAQHEFPKNPLINVTGNVDVGQVRCAASIPARNRMQDVCLPRQRGASRRGLRPAVARVYNRWTRRPEDSDRFAPGTLGLSRGGRAPRVQAGALRGTRRGCGR